MTKPLTDGQLAGLRRLLGGNDAALKFCLDVLWVGHLWDDLVDGDVRRTPDEVSRAFLAAFHELQVNPFIQSLPIELRWHVNGLLASTALQYYASTRLEAKREHKLQAFICRNAVLGLIQYVAVLCGTDPRETAELFIMFPLEEEFDNFLKEPVRHESPDESGD